MKMYVCIMYCFPNSTFPYFMAPLNSLKIKPGSMIP